jgi:hypothetical protein
VRADRIDCCTPSIRIDRRYSAAKRLQIQGPSMLSQIFKPLASLKLAVLLIVVLAGVLAVATVLEAEKGREFAQWYVYGSYWFIGLLALLGINILAATLIRFPWKKHQTGFVVTHAGLLVLLFGSIQTFVGGVEGRVAMLEGESANKIMLIDRSVVTVTRPTGQGRGETAFSFRPGPVDWPAGHTLDFGVADGLGLKVLGYRRRGREQVDWVEDHSKAGAPALKLILTGENSRIVEESWLEGNVYGGQAVLGPTKFQIWPVAIESMTKDFLEPPPQDEMGDRGVLAIHYQGQRLTVAVDDHVGKEVSVADDGAKVEIVEYIANAKPTPEGGFVSRGDVPKNPLLELTIHLPGEEQPIRQVAFALRPLLNLDAVHGRVCPVKFWYHHPAVTAAPGARFLQTPDGKLYCRAVVGGQCQPPREVREGDRIPLGSQFAVRISEYLPHARQQVTFVSSPPAGEGGETFEAAALVEVDVDGVKRRFWLRRNDPRYGQQWVMTKRGPAKVSFEYDHLPLDFSLTLVDFKRDFNPGGMGAAAFASQVRLVDPARAINEEREISMNSPLVNGKFTFYQSSFQETGHGKEASVFTAAYDPGRLMKYLGSLMICGGIFIMFYMRSYMFRRIPSFLGGRREKPQVGTKTAVEEKQVVRRAA